MPPTSSVSFAIFGCSTPPRFALPAILSACAKSASASKSALVPAPFFLRALSQNFRNGAIPWASRMFSA